MTKSFKSAILFAMSLQDSFYILGIVFMSLSIIILIGIVILLFYIKKKITDIHKFAELKIEDITEFTSRPIKRAVSYATSLLSGRSKSGRRKN